mgnify:CR=1 FL=1
MENQSTGRTVGIVVAVIVVGLGFWYFVMKSPATDSQTSVEQVQIPAPTVGNTTADISADLNQIPDTSTALDAEAAATANEFNSL